MSAIKGWSEGEKLGLVFQIISKAPIPWSELTLPEGRTLKACQVMIDKEKSKLKEAREENGKDVGGETATKKTAPKKRKGGDEDDAEGSRAKKSPRKGGKATTSASEEGGEDAEEEEPEPKPKGKKTAGQKCKGKNIVVKAEVCDDEEM